MDERVVVDLYGRNLGVILLLLQTANLKARQGCAIYNSGISRDQSVHAICENYALCVSYIDINDPR